MIIQAFLLLAVSVAQRNNISGRASDVRPSGHGFDSRYGRNQAPRSTQPSIPARVGGMTPVLDAQRYVCSTGRAVDTNSFRACLLWPSLHRSTFCIHLLSWTTVKSGTVITIFVTRYTMLYQRSVASLLHCC